MRVITRGGAHVNRHGRKDSHTSFVTNDNGSMAFSLADAMGINFILFAIVVVGALLLLGADMLKLRRFWSQHKEDTLLALLLISLFIGAFVLIVYLLVHRFEQPTSPSLVTPPVPLTSIVLSCVALAKNKGCDISPTRFLSGRLAGSAAGEKEQMKLDIAQRLTLLLEKGRSYLDYKEQSDRTRDIFIIAAVITVVFQLFLLAAYLITRF